MAAKRVADLGEFGLIARLRERVATSARVVEGIGDDAAVLEGPEAGRLLLFACDTIAEGVHFRPDDAPELVGRKALACNLSDIAAMGGVPRAATLAFGCKPETPVEVIDGLWAGMRALAAEFGTDLVGGDTHRSPHGLVLSVAIVGEVERELCVYRRGARAGDFVAVTGALGGSIAGRHLGFTPRVREGRWLAERERRRRRAPGRARADLGRRAAARPGRPRAFGPRAGAVRWRGFRAAHDGAARIARRGGGGLP
jgi:thiamine-monophosphate kinase